MTNAKPQAAWFVTQTLARQQAPSPALHSRERPGSSAALPGTARRGGRGQRTRPGQGSGEEARRGLRSHACPFVPSRRRRPGLGGPCPHLVDVAVGAAADALDQLEVLLRVPAGQVEAGVHGGPRVPPASLPARGGGALRGAARRERPRPPGSAAGHNRPAARRGRRRPRRAARRPRPPPPRGAGSHPPGEERARSPSLRVQLQHGFRPPLRPPALPPVPGPRATAQPPSRRPRAPGGPRALPPCAPLGTLRTRQTRCNKVGRTACSVAPRPEPVVVALCETVSLTF